jgi:hypothetical protein
VHAKEALRMFQAGSKITNGQSRSIAADHRTRVCRRLDATQHRTLDLGLLQHRLFDQIGPGYRLSEGVGGSQVFLHQVGRTGFEETLLLEVLRLPA